MKRRIPRSSYTPQVDSAIRTPASPPASPIASPVRTMPSATRPGHRLYAVSAQHRNPDAANESSSVSVGDVEDAVLAAEDDLPAVGGPRGTAGADRRLD